VASVEKEVTQRFHVVRAKDNPSSRRFMWLKMESQELGCAGGRRGGLKYYVPDMMVGGDPVDL